MPVNIDRQTVSGFDKQAIIDQTAKTVKAQQDRKREVFTNKSVFINPQNLVTANPTTFGPYYFETTFAVNPYITFGQVRIHLNQGTNEPFVVQPYVDGWVSSSGGITGFTLGVYALLPVPSGLTRHTITWLARGKASLYKPNNVQDKWKNPYNNVTSTHLSQGVGFQ